VPKKLKTQASAGRVKFTVFWKSEGVVLTDLLEKGVRVNWEHYSETLKNLKKRIMRKGAEIDDILLQHNNAKPHTTAATTDGTAHLGFTVLPHLANSPDLSPRDFHLLPKLKEDL
jgi:hypothetical protein